MKKAILLIWVAAVLCAAPEAGAAELSYNYFSAGYDSSTFGKGTAGTMFELEGAFGFGGHQHMSFRLTSANYNNDTEVSERTLAFGFHGALSRKIHMLGQISAESMTFYNRRLNWDDGCSGVGGEIRFRYLTDGGSEIASGYKMMQLDGMQAKEYKVETATYFSDTVAVTVGYVNRDATRPFPSESMYRFGLRMDM